MFFLSTKRPIFPDKCSEGRSQERGLRACQGQARTGGGTRRRKSGFRDNIQKSLKILKNNFVFQIFVVHLQSQNNAGPLRELSSVGSERLPYKQRVGGSTPSAPTKNQSETTGFLFAFLHSPAQKFFHHRGPHSPLTGQLANVTKPVRKILPEIPA